MKHLIQIACFKTAKFNKRLDDNQIATNRKKREKNDHLFQTEMPPKTFDLRHLYFQSLEIMTMIKRYMITEIEIN